MSYIYGPVGIVIDVLHSQLASSNIFQLEGQFEAVFVSSYIPYWPFKSQEHH